MTCEALINRFLADYVDGALPAARKAEFRVHLALCGACRKYVASYRRTLRLARLSGAAHEAPAEAPAELIEAILRVARER